MGGIGDALLNGPGYIADLEKQQQERDTITKSQADITGLAKRIVELESAGDDALRNISKNTAAADIRQMQVNDGRRLTPQEKASVWQSHFDGLKQNRDSDLGASRQALHDVLQRGGGGKSVYDVLMFPDQQEAISNSAPWKPKPTQVLMEMAQKAAPDRQAKILLGALTPEERAQMERDTQTERVGAPVGTRGWVGKGIHALTAPARAVAGGLANAVTHLQQVAPAEVQDVPPVPEAVWSDEPQSVKDLLATTKQSLARLAPGFSNILGVNIRKAMQAGDNTYEPSAGLAQGIAAARGESDDKTSLGFAQANANRSMLAQAVKIAQGKAAKGSIPSDQASILAEAKRLVQNNDMLGGVSPNVVQTAGEVALDPLNLVNPFALAGGAAKTAAKLPGVEQGVEAAAKLGTKVAETPAAQWLVKHGTYLPEAKALEETGKATDKVGVEGQTLTTGDLAAGRMRMAEAESHSVAHDFAAFAGERLARMEKVPAKIRTTVLDAFLREGPKAGAKALIDTKTAMTPELQDALKAGEELRTEMLRVKQEHGLGYRWQGDDTGSQVLVTAQDTALPNYVPRRNMNEKGAASMKRYKSLEDRGIGLDKPDRAMLHPRSALERTLSEDWYKGVDPVKQFRDEAYSLNAIIPKAAEMKGMVVSLGEAGAITKLMRSGENFVMADGTKMTKDELGKVLDSLSQKHSVEYAMTSPDLARVVQGVTGKSDEKVGATFIAPRPVIERMEALAPVIGGKQGNFVEVMTGFNKLMDRYIRPYHAAIKLGRTQFGSPWGFAARNAASAVMVSGVNHGLAAANPKVALPVLQTVLAAAGHGVQEARATKFALPSGEVTNLGFIIDTMKKLGALDQLETRTGVDAFSPLAKQGLLMRGMRKATETLSPFVVPLGKSRSIDTLNKGIDNFQRVTAFMQFLKGTDKDSIATAFDAMSKYAGNYRRMSDIERYALRDVFGFYSWNRYILPHFTEQLIKHPERFAVWAKARGYLQRETPIANFTDFTTSDQNRDLMVPLPKIAAKPGSHEWAVAALEDPLSMLFSPIQQFVGSGVGHRTELGLASQLSPIASLGIELFLGVDPRTGQQITEPPPFDMKELADSIGRRTAVKKFSGPIAQYLLAPMERATPAYLNLVKLLFDKGVTPNAALSAAMAYKAQRDFGALGVIAAHLKGQPVAPAAMIPGVTPQVVDPLKQTARRQAGLAKRAKDVRYSLGKSNTVTDALDALER